MVESGCSPELGWPISVLLAGDGGGGGGLGLGCASTCVWPVGQGEDLEEKKEESESTVRNFPGLADEKMSEALESEGGGGLGSARSSPLSSLLAPDPRLISDLEEYVLRPAVRGCTMQCCISRDKRGIDKGMFPFYYLYLEAINGHSRKVPSGGGGQPPPLRGLTFTNPGLAHH